MNYIPLLISALIKFAALLTLVTGANVHANVCDNWESTHTEWLWCDDFEGTGAITSRYEDVSVNGMSVTPNTGIQDSHSLTQVYTPGQVDAGWIVKYRAEGFPDHLFYRFDHKFGPGYTTAFPQKMSRVGFRDRSNWQEVIRVHTWLDRFAPEGIMTLDTLARDSSQANAWGYLPVIRTDYHFIDHLEEWVSIEVEVKLNTPGETDGVYRMWINDELVAERINTDLRGSTNDKINEVMLDCYWNGGATDNLSRYYDNFVISTRRIGSDFGEQPDSASPPSPPANFQVTRQQ